MAKQTNSLAHTKRMCKYHIIFTPKYRRKMIYNQYKTDLRDSLKQLCSYSYARPCAYVGEHTAED